MAIEAARLKRLKGPAGRSASLPVEAARGREERLVPMPLRPQDGACLTVSVSRAAVLIQGTLGAVLLRFEA